MGVYTLAHTTKPLNNRVELPPAWGIKDIITLSELSPLLLILVSRLPSLQLESQSQAFLTPLKFSQSHNQEGMSPVNFK